MNDTEAWVRIFESIRKTGQLNSQGTAEKTNEVFDVMKKKLSDDREKGEKSDE